MRAARGAFTLVEVLLGSTLGLMLLGIFVFTLIPLLRYGSWTSSRATLVQAGVLVGDRLGGDLQKAPLTGVSLAGQAVAVHPVAGATDSGVAVWDKILILYDWSPSTGDLLRWEWGGSGNDMTLAPQRLALTDIRAARNGTRPHRLVQGLLKSFSVTTTAGDLPLVIRLRLETPVSGRPPQRFDYSREVTLRCGT